MKKLLFFAAFFVCCTGIFAQTNSVKGRITNEKNEPASLATVLLLSVKDSAVVKYATSDNSGAYRLSQIANGQYWVEVRYVGYSTQRTKVGVFGNNNLDVNFKLEEDITTLEASKVKANYRGLEFSGDTIIYNPLAYTDGSEVTLGEMMNKLPGINVSESGKVTAQGKDVDAILIEGRDLFSGNTQVPLQNLPASIAEKVEVVNNYSEYDIMKGFQSYEKTAINVKVNKSFWEKISGNISLAGGVQNKYYTKNNIIRLMPKFMASLTFSGNNLGENLLEFDDYIKMKGGLNEFSTGSGSFTFSLDETDMALLGSANANTYSSTNNLGILNISAQPSEKLKINTYGLFNMSKFKDQDESRYTYFNASGDEHYTKLTKGVKRNKMGSGFLKLSYNPSSTLNYIYQGIFTDALAKSTSDIDNIDLFTLSQNRRETLSTTHNFTAIKKIKENVFTANMNFIYKNIPTEYNFQTDSLLLPFTVAAYNDLFYILQQKNTKQKTASVDLSYLYKLNPSYFIKFALGANYTRNNFTSFIYENHLNDDRMLIGDEHFINDSYFGYFNQTLNANITKNQGIFRFKAGLTLRNMIFYHNIARTLDDKNKITAEPELEISIMPKQSRRFSVSYSKSMSITSIADLISNIYINGFDSYANGSAFTKFFANRHVFSTMFSDFNQFYNTQFFTTLRYGKTDMKASKDYYRTGSLNEMRTVATPSQYDIWGTSSFSKKFLFAPISANISLTYRQNAYSYFSAGNEIKSKTYSTSVDFGVSSSYKEGFNFGLDAAFSRNQYKTIVANKQDIQRYSGKISFRKNNFYISTSLDYEHNNARSIMQYFYYWNADIRYSFADKKYELQLLGNDMLHTSDKHWREISYTDNAMIESFMRRIPGSIILKFNMKIQ
ncbi:MAG: carboxypeptidase-like regulatory domain-containing protein [Prevotellaceae bacterium]|nr:carboxypeptidase-like regulatory domain-containing protein [Prevotellaceae bacterium]